MSKAETSEQAPTLTLTWVAGWAFVVVAFVTYTSAFREQPRVLFGFLCLTAGWVAAAFIHECGHALAALLCRWRVILFVVRPFGIQFPNRNLAFVRRGYNDGAGGWVAMVPRRASADTRINWAIIVAAGPLASLILAVIAFAASASAPTPVSPPPLIVAHLWFGFAVQALYGGIFSLLPSARRPGASDGDQLRALRRIDSNEYELLRPASWTSMLTAHKVQLRDIPGWMMTEVTRSAERSDKMARCLAELEIGRLLDDPPVDPTAARALLDAYRERHGASSWLASCDAYCAVIWEDAPERAEAALAEIQPPSNVPAMTAAAEAALAAWLGDEATVGLKLAEMREALKTESPFRDGTFREIETQIEARLARTLAVNPAQP